MEEARLCKCHGEPMRWRTDRSCKGGGQWRCRIHMAEAHHRYGRSEKARERAKRYRLGGRNRAVQSRYARSLKGRLQRAAARRERENMRDREKIASLLSEIREV